MKHQFIVAACCAVALISGCAHESPQSHNKQPQEIPQMAPSVFMPIEFEIVPQPTSAQTAASVSLNILYKADITGSPQLSIYPIGNTVIINALPETAYRALLPAAKSGAKFQKKIDLSGNAPAIEAHIEYQDNGLGFDIREVYPKIDNIAKKQRDLNCGQQNLRSPLPAAIQIDENHSISTGIDVTP